MSRQTPSEKTVLAVEDLIGGFDAENATKKDIKELRKALTDLSHECYPKPDKKKKVAKKAAKKSKK